VRTTLDISDEAYYIAKAIARDQNRSLGREDFKALDDEE
jgi:hypothetical protein